MRFSATRWTHWPGSPHETLQPRAGVGRRHLRQPGHDHAGAVGPTGPGHFRVEVERLGEVAVTVA